MGFSPPREPVSTRQSRASPSAVPRALRSSRASTPTITECFTTRDRSAALIENGNGANGVPAYRGIRNYRYLYVEHNTTGEYELYDLLKDPFELASKDGADEYAQFAAKMTAAFSFYELIPQNFVVDIGSDGTASGRSYSLEVAEDAETKDWLEFYGVFRDEYRLLESGWRFSGRHYRTHARRRGGHLEAFKL